VIFDMRIPDSEGTSGGGGESTSGFLSWSDRLTTGDAPDEAVQLAVTAVPNKGAGSAAPALSLVGFGDADAPTPAAAATSWSARVAALAGSAATGKRSDAYRWLGTFGDTIRRILGQADASDATVQSWAELQAEHPDADVYGLLTASPRGLAARGVFGWGAESDAGPVVGVGDVLSAGRQAVTLSAEGPDKYAGPVNLSPLGAVVPPVTLGAAPFARPLAPAHVVALVVAVLAGLWLLDAP
jgi:hypothetical protein